MNQNRRKFNRIGTRDANCIVKLGIEESAGIVVDESIDGIRLGQLALLVLVADQKIKVEYDDQEFVGRCRSVSRDENDLFEIGVYRETDDYQQQPISMLLNSFVHFNNCNIVCVPLTVIDENRIRIRLLHGKEFTANRNQILQLTRKERTKELADEKHLADIIQVYAMMNSPKELNDLDSILYQEFGPSIEPIQKTAASLSAGNQ